MSLESMTLRVEGMSCSHCENAIKKALTALNGVESVLVDLKGKKVTVEFHQDKVDAGTIRGTIEDQGYEVK